MSREERIEQLLALKSAESVTLRCALARLSDAAQRFLQEPFSKRCALSLRAAILAAATDVHRLDELVRLLPTAAPTADVPPAPSPREETR